MSPTSNQDPGFLFSQAAVSTTAPAPQMHMCAPECMHVHLSVCMHTADALRSEENIGFPGTDVTGCSEIPDVWVVGIEPVFSARSASALNH